MISNERTLTLSRLKALRWHHLALIALFIMVVVPFAVFWRAWPQLDFYPESVSLLAALGVALGGLAAAKQLILPKTAVCFGVMAVFWMLQGRLMSIVYVGQADLMGGVWLIYAFLAMGVAGLCARFGREYILGKLVQAFMVAMAAQDIICLLQFFDVQHVGAWIINMGAHEVAGNFSQRNNLAHFLMWGMCAGAYALAKRLGPQWLLIPLMLISGMILGLVLSRSILMFVMLLFGFLALCLVRSSPEAKPFFKIWIGLMTWVLFWQFAMAPLLHFTENMNHGSGLTRLANESNTNTLRRDEWIKCWELIKARPWLGYGWGGYVYQAYLIDGIDKMDGRLQRGSLFLNPHNSFLHIWVDMGLLGLGILGASFVWCTRRAIRHFRQPENALLIGMMLITLSHSFVEFPLWWVYFLTVFVLLIILSDPEPLRIPGPSLKSPITHHTVRFSALGATIALIGGMIFMWSDYSRLQTYMENTHMDTQQDTENKMSQMIALGKRNYLLAPYADFAAIRILKPDNPTVPNWALEHARRYASYRPYAAHALNAMLLEYRFGDKEAALTELRHMMRYYRILVPRFTQSVQNSVHYQGLFTPLYVQCEQYRQKYPDLKSCLVLPKNTPNSAKDGAGGSIQPLQ